MTTRLFLCSFSLLALVACGDDSAFSESSPGPSGTGGGAAGGAGQSSAGQGGTASGSGGAKAAGGGGLAGTAGTGGAAGGTAGAAGMAGTNGGASGKASGGSGGVAGTSSGGAASGGDGGAAGMQQGGAGGDAGGAAGESGSGGAPQGGAPQGGAGGAGGVVCAEGPFKCGSQAELFECQNGDYAFVQLCEADRCNADLGKCVSCQPGAPVGCADQATAQVCSIDGETTDSVNCDGATPFCSAGQCVACLADSDCPAPAADKPCFEATCTPQHTCAITPKLDGADPTSAPEAPLCQKLVCDGSGKTKLITDTSHTPPFDGNDCTFELCNGDQPSTGFVSVGTVCASGQGFCNGQGVCGECAPGTTRCIENLHQTCSPLGQWADEPCALPKQICSEGACVGVTSVVSGHEHSCVILDDTTVRCWGVAKDGQLGFDLPGAELYSRVPVTVSGLTGAVQVSTGTYHTCAVKNDGTLWCWGSNNSGQLGIGTLPENTFTPLQVTDLGNNVAQVSAGEQHTCAMTKDGKAYCWGANLEGRLGIGTSGPPEVTPKEVTGAGKVLAIQAGNSHTCALSELGAVFCWGHDGKGQLGNGSSVKDPQVIPVLVTNSTASASLFSNWDNACRLTANGSGECWGDDSSCQISNTCSGQAPYVVSQPISTFLNAVRIGAGEGRVCALLTNKQVQCRGSGIEYALGNGVLYGMSGNPVITVLEAENTTMNNIEQLAVGRNHGCVLLADGDVRCWGACAQGECGSFPQGPFGAAQFAASVNWQAQ